MKYYRKSHKGIKKKQTKGTSCLGGHRRCNPLGNYAMQAIYRKNAQGQRCARASGRHIFILHKRGIHMGVSYLRAGTTFEISNMSKKAHSVLIVPSSLVSVARFILGPGSTVAVRVLSVNTIQGGSIVVNPGSSQTVHDIVVCP